MQRIFKVVIGWVGEWTLAAGYEYPKELELQTRTPSREQDLANLLFRHETGDVVVTNIL